MRNEVCHIANEDAVKEPANEPLPVITGSLNEPSADKTTVPASRFKNGGVTVLK